MELLNLTLTNFRNFSSKKLVFDQKLTVIIGPNGSGKSNILEAIALLCGQKSQKVDTDLDLVMFGMNEVKVETHLQRFERSDSGQGKEFNFSEGKKLTINYVVVDERRVTKAYFVDSIKKSLGDFMHNLAVVNFHPEDLDLVSGSPSLRRHHLDSLLSSVDREYWRNLSSYGKVLTRRNKVLFRIAENKSRQGELDFWDERLLAHGKFISKRREEFFEFLNLPGQEKIISPDLSWELKQSLISADKLIKNRERDIAARMTLSGPQRDDFRFLFNGKDLEYFGSRGEQRMAVLALKIAELEYFQLKIGERPILALDDIFSELDWEHRETVLSVVGKQQTIITAAEEESVPKKLLKKATVIELS